MTATWTTPKTWNTGDPLLASELNQHLRDNMEWIKAPPSNQYKANEGSDYSTTSTSFANVDNTNWNYTLSTAGGVVMVGFFGNMAVSAGTITCCLDVEVDGSRWGGDDGLLAGAVGTTDEAFSFVVPITGLSAGNHVFKLQWKLASAGTLTMRAGAGTSTGRDNHPVFWVREVP